MKGIKYEFNKEIKKEFEDIKKVRTDAGCLEPYDPKKKIYVKTNASKSGLGYVMYEIEGESSA